MKKLRYICLFFFALTFISAVQAIKPEARYNLLNIHYNFHADGSMDYNCRKELTLFTHTAMNRTYGETFIAYNPKFQEVTVNEAYTLQKNGKKILLPKNALVTVLPKCAAGAPDFNQLKELVVVHTGLELGATIFLDYTIHTKKGFYPFFEVNELLQQSSPLKRCEVTVSFPSNRFVNLQVIGGNGSTKITEKENITTCRYSFKNVPALSREAYQMKYHANCLQLVGSENSIQKALISIQQRFHDQIPVELKADAVNALKKEKVGTSKNTILCSLLAKRLASKPLPYALAGLTLRSFTRICNSAYATVPELAALSSELFKLEGCKADVVAVVPAHIDPENTGLMNVINWLVRVEDNGSFHFYDVAKNKEINFNTQTRNERYYTLKGEELLIQRSENRVVNNKKMSVDEGKKEGNYTILNLPAFPNGIDAWRMNTLPSKRFTVLELPSPIVEEANYTIVLDSKNKFQPSKYNKKIKNIAGSFLQSIEKRDSTLIVKRKMVLERACYTPKEYYFLRTLLNEWYDKNNKVLLFKK